MNDPRSAELPCEDPGAVLPAVEVVQIAQGTT